MDALSNASEWELKDKYKIYCNNAKFFYMTKFHTHEQ